MGLFTSPGDDFESVYRVMKMLRDEHEREKDSKKKEDIFGHKKRGNFGTGEIFCLFTILSILGGPALWYWWLWGVKQCLEMMKTIVQ